MIKTIGELKKAIANIDYDFTIDVRIVRELSEEELSGSSYPYPYEYVRANLEIGDIGYSDKNVIIHVEDISDDVCEWKLEDKEANLYLTGCQQRQLIFEGTPKENGYRYCPYCGKNIKVME